MKFATVVARWITKRLAVSGSGVSGQPEGEAKQALYRGFGDALSQAFELTLTPMIFGFFGVLLDRAAGTGHLFAVSFVVLALIGIFVRMWCAYEVRMREIEANSPWAPVARRDLPAAEDAVLAASDVAPEGPALAQ